MLDLKEVMKDDYEAWLIIGGGAKKRSQKKELIFKFINMDKNVMEVSMGPDEIPISVYSGLGKAVRDLNLVETIGVIRRGRRIWLKRKDKE